MRFFRPENQTVALDWRQQLDKRGGNMQPVYKILILCIVTLNKS